MEFPVQMKFSELRDKDLHNYLKPYHWLTGL